MILAGEMSLVKKRDRGYNEPMNERKDLYSAADIVRLEKRIIRVRSALLLSAAAVLAFCVLLCFRTNTANAERMEYTVIAVTVAAGWLLLYLRRFVLLETRWELGHAKMLHESEKEILRGTVTVSAEKLRILNSFPFRHVTVETEGKTRRVNVIEGKAAELERSGKELELFVANGYVAAFRKI